MKKRWPIHSPPAAQFYNFEYLTYDCVKSELVRDFQLQSDKKLLVHATRRGGNITYYEHATRNRARWCVKKSRPTDIMCRDS